MADIVTLSFLSYETYPTEAKLNSSGGYRARKVDVIGHKFVLVKFENETIVTGIATQGFGDPDIKEWVTEYFIKFTRQKSGDEETDDYIFGSDGRPKVIHLIPKWPPFKYSFVFLQISPCRLALKLEIQKIVFP